MMIFCHSVVHGVRRQNRQPLVIPCLSEVVLAQGPRPQYYKPAPQTVALERQGVASSSHSRYSTTTIFLSNFSKKACTMLGDEELCGVYHAAFFAWYAQRLVRGSPYLFSNFGVGS